MSIDTTKPSIGRIYDYVLGGHHNFEADRIAAQQILKSAPSYTTWARLNRWFLQMVAEQWAASGHNYVLDLGSGMPTQGHFHTVSPQAKILYSDIDPMTVAYARDVLGDNSLVSYVQTDIRNPVDLLESADRLFQGQRQVAIGFIGLSYFLDDESLARVAQTLHEWAAPGSVMALSYGYMQASNEQAQEKLETFKRNSAQVYIRDEAQVRALLTPWKVSESQPLASWLGMEHLLQESDREGVGVDMYGVTLVHEG
ncbi:MAG TPA: SAM-dependent methyltransferase [Roseiflexaceae bacterium]|nr:SAM-dependent methyltransferase [Roseiflexaceae bacterium]